MVGRPGAAHPGLRLGRPVLGLGERGVGPTHIEAGAGDLFYLTGAQGGAVLVFEGVIGRRPPGRPGVHGRRRPAVRRA
ncbi:MAG: hypothetical protein LC808_04140 [Actinobacteria bacterium]|nr:hypothetical protein [Actinomycetota bacterium]